jgi:hypothetical protein
MHVEVPGAGEHVGFSSVRLDASLDKFPDELCDARREAVMSGTLLDLMPSEDFMSRHSVGSCLR